MLDPYCGSEAQILLATREQSSWSVPFVPKRMKQLDHSSSDWQQVGSSSRTQIVRFQLVRDVSRLSVDQHEESNSKRGSVQTFVCLIGWNAALIGEVAAKYRVIKPARADTIENLYIVIVRQDNF